MTKFIAVYMTARSQKEAKKLGEKLVKERLVACASVIAANSVYRWNGKIERHGEAVIIAKTRTALFKKLLSFVKKNHSYSVPCVNALPIKCGNPDYLKWIERETKI